MPGDGHQRVAAVQPDEGTHVVLSSRNQGPKGHQRGGLISPVSPQPPDVHIAAARPASAAAERQHAAVVYPQPLAKQRRPASAGVHKRPITPAGSDAVASPSMSPSKTAVRPLSAAGKLGPSSNAAMARLKAELAGLASIGNVQLQSLRPSTPAAADIKRTDACSELEAKVLGELKSLEQQLNLTYTQARLQPSNSPAALKPGATAPGKAVDEFAHASGSYTAAESQQQNSQPQPPLESSPRTTDNNSKQQPVFGNKDALSAFLAVLQGETGYNEEQAKAEIEQMRQWVAEQDIRLLETSVAAKFSNKAVAARISQLLSENQVLQYQRHHYESALAELREDPTYGSNARWKQQQQAALLAAFEAEAAAAAQSADDMPQSPGKSSRKAPKKQRLHHGLDAAYFLARLTGTNSASKLTAHASSAHLDSILAQATSFGSSLDGSSSDNSDTEGGNLSDGSRDNRSQLQQESSGIDADVKSQYKQLETQSKYRRHLSAVKSAADTAAEEAEESGTQQKPGYTGSAAVVGRANLSRCISRSSDILQLSHIGMRPYQLYKVSQALTEAPWIRKIDLSGNLLTDQAVAGLVDLLLNIPSAVIVTHLDLSQNHMLTWRCCAVLSGLLSQQQQQLAQSSSSRSNPTSANTSASGNGSSQHSSVVTTAAAFLGSSADSLDESDTFFAEGGTTTGSSSSVAEAVGTPQSQPQQMQLLQMVCISLAGVGIGDKGAAALAGALASNSSLQVLHLARCGLHDPGGAAICMAVRQHPALSEVDLSWNALGHNTARAVEAAFRWPTCSLSQLSLSHCGLDDRDGARILDALTPASFKLSYSTISGANVAPGTIMGKDGCILKNNWIFVDLSHNSLEGGAALCAAAVIEAFGDVEALGTSSSSSQQQQQHQQQAVGKLGNHANSNSFGSRGAACRTLLLDGNPLGVSGVRCIARALAGQPSVGLLPHTDSSRGGAVGSGTAALTTSGGYCPSESWFKGEGLSSGAASMLQQQQGQLQLSLHVGIAKVTLVAKEKGVRASMRDTHASMAPASLVPTLYDAIDTSDPSKHKLPGIAASSKPGKDTKAVSGKSSALAADASKGGALVINETAAGFDLTCPGGQYRLHLAHPAVRHLVHQLLDLRNRLQQLNRQVKDQQQSQQQQQQLVTAVSSQGPPRSRRVTRSEATEETEPTGGTAGSSAVPSRRVTGTISTAGLSASAATGAAVPQPSTAAPTRQQKRKVLSCPVDIPAIFDVRLDGKLVKLEVLLEQQPWYKPPTPGMSSTDGISSGVIIADSAAAGARSSMDAASRASTGGASSTAKQGKGKGRKHPKQLEFTVKSAAVLAGHEPHVMPQQLLQRVLQSISDATVSDVWKLQLLELLLPDWLLTPHQAGQLLGMFDRELAVEEQLSAAGLMWARLVQPADFWEQVLPAALKPVQQQRFKDLLGPQLMAFDRQNLTGSYTLNLGWSVHKAVAQRLQSAALQDNSTSECRYYICWRNVSLNGSPIREPAIAQLQNFAIPSNGTLKLDYVGYQVPASGCPPASADEMRWLLAGLRALQGAYYSVPLALRQEYIPGGLRRSQEEEKAAAARARTASKKLYAGKSAASNSNNKPADSSDPAQADDKQQQQELLLLPSQQAPWWEASGLDPSALLLKYSARLSGSVPGRLSTAGPLMTAQSLDKPSRPGTRDRSASAASTKRRPSTAAAASRSSSAIANAVAENGTGASAPSTAGAASTRPSTAGAAAAVRSVGGSTVKSNRSSKAPWSSGLTASAAGADADAASSGLGSGVSNEEWLARLLATTAPHEAAAMFIRVGEAHAACLMQLLAALPSGPAAVAALIECLSPVVAVRFLADVPGHVGLLPASLRAQVEPLLKPTVAESIEQVSAAVAKAATSRTTQQLLLIRQFATKASGISCSQLVAILKLLAAQGQGDRCAAIVALWSKVVDRSSLVEVFDGLSGSEQLGLMSALGSYHVWSTLAKPDGLHFRLDLTVPEQRDVAREVVKVAVRRSLSERAATGVRVQHLEQLTAEGKPVLDPEDDKLWLSLESKHTLLEFNYSRTWEQELRLMAGAVKRIQRAWRKRRLRRLESKAGTAISGAGSGIIRTTTWPMSKPSTLGGGRLGYEQLGGLGYKPGVSGLSSELSLGINSELTSTSSAMYTATTVSSLLPTPLSLSGYMSEVSGYISETPPPPQQQQPGGEAAQRDNSSAGISVGVAIGLTLSQKGVGEAHDSAKPTPRLF